MVETKIWLVEFGQSEKRVVACNVKDAILKALSKKHRDWAYQRVQDIRKVELIAKAEY